MAEALQACTIPIDTTSPKCDKNLSSVTGSVTGQSVTSHYAYTLESMKADPDCKWNSKKVEKLLHVKPPAARQILSRLHQAGKIIKTGYGFYQYCADKNGQLSALISHSGSVGIENLVYVTQGTRYPLLQPQNTTEISKAGNKCDNLPTAKEGYPRHLQTGQEILWEEWKSNGSERLSFISHGNPFSVDLIIYLHDELKQQGFKVEDWQRVSIEVNKDTETLTLTKECMTFQDTQSVFCKAYLHGKQARFEHANRQEAPMKDALSLFLKLSDDRDGKTALKEIRERASQDARNEERMKKADDRSRAAFKAVINMQDQFDKFLAASQLQRLP